MKRANLFINRINLSKTVLHTHDSWSWKAFWAFDKACDFISAASESVQEKFQAKYKSKSNITYLLHFSVNQSCISPYVSAFSMSINTPPWTVFTFCLAEGSSNFFKICCVPSSGCEPESQSNSLISKILQLPGGLISQWEEKDSIRYFPRHLAEFQSIVNFRTRIFWTFISRNLQVEIKKKTKNKNNKKYGSLLGNTGPKNVSFDVHNRLKFGKMSIKDLLCTKM